MENPGKWIWSCCTDPGIRNFNSREQVVKYGAQPQSGYSGSRYAGDDSQSEYEYRRDVTAHVVNHFG